MSLETLTYYPSNQPSKEIILSIQNNNNNNMLISAKAPFGVVLIASSNLGEGFSIDCIATLLFYIFNFM